ncbi:MAG: lytic transglycosylase domain-containing protein [Verrucomicrobiota bacterium]|nr:lytic transglycosylase domain-containing protein [Verrucomicrobiota bacterium]
MKSIFRISLICLILTLVAGGAWFVRNHYKKKRIVDFDSQVYETSIKFGVDRDLILAVIWRESKFDHMARGDAGERGLMQIMPAAADDFVKFQKIKNFVYDDLFKPEVNVTAGTWYLSRAIKRWAGRDDPVPFALAEYNAGRKHALRWASGDTNMTAEQFINNIDFPSTKSYVTNILNKYEKLRNESK